jgi:uncharacterized membrane protein YphA (DoxX/SURF4 family)
MSKTNSKVNNIILHTSRVVFGLVFIFSGIVKAVDPLGSTYKFQDYFTAFGGMFTSISDNAFMLAIALSTIELFIGLNLLFAIQVRRTAFLGLLFMLVMTPLTLYIALENPVSDCGCFGEALIISNWATFWKNIILLALILTILFTTRPHQSFFVLWIEWFAMAAFIGFGIGISLYAYNHLPQIDFMPYKKGVNIAEAMKIPEGAPQDVTETTFIYEKNGTQQEFTLENYPKDDSSWVFVDQKTTLIEEGYKPPIHDFRIFDNMDEDTVPELLEYKGYTYLLILYDINRASEEGAKQAEKFYNNFKNTSVRFYAITASADEDIATFTQKTNISFPFYKADPITLKTVIRANPGLVLIKDGTIVGKWHWKDIF